MKTKPIIFAVLTWLAPALLSQADIIHVPADQPTIQSAINIAVDGDTVLVADGTYTGSGFWDIDFLGLAITVISENGPENCVISAGGGDHRVFHFHNFEGRDSVLEGFTIRDGYVWSFPSGGGILCEGSSPTIRGNIITENTIENGDLYDGGGGIACFDASPLIIGNVISANTVDAPHGGGIYCDDGSSPEIIENTIEGNSVHQWYYAGIGGGLCAIDCTLVIRDNIIRANSATAPGGGIYLYLCTVQMTGNLVSDHGGQSGSGVSFYDCSGTCSNNTLFGNEGYYAGGIHCWGTAPALAGNTITGNDGSGINCAGASPEIAFNTVTGNTISGISCSSGSMPEIHDNIISENLGTGIKINGNGTWPTIRQNFISGNTGGIACTSEGNATLLDNMIQGNAVTGRGGGIGIFSGGTVVVDSCRVLDNESTDKGAGIYVGGTSSCLLNNTLIAGNHSGDFGGGINVALDTTLQMDNCTVTTNTANLGGGLFSWGTVAISNSIVWGNLEEELRGEFIITYSDIGGGWPGIGNMDADPLFVEGVLGEYYLSHIAAGQAADSGCVDAGDPTSKMVAGTTRTDLEQDTGIVDMGYHYSLEAGPRLVAGPGPGPDNPPLVKVFPPRQNAPAENEFTAYGAPHHGVNVSTGDVTGDSADDILTGAGPGVIFGPHVRGFEADGTPLSNLNFLAYGTNKWGVNVAAGDLDGDGFDEIITGAGPGPVFGPHVRGWNYDGSGPVTAMTDVNFFAYGTPQWGVKVCGGDIDGDGMDEIVTGAGPGTIYGPHVRGWDYENATVTAIPEVSFMAYGTHRFGVNVTCGDVDGDYIDEIVTAPGPGLGFGSHVRGWNFDGDTITPLKGMSYFAWPHPEFSFGATVFAGADLDGDGRDELVVGCGPDPAVFTPVKVYRYDGLETVFWFSLEGYVGLTHGTNVAAGRF